MDYTTTALKAWSIPGELGSKPIDKEWKGTPAHLGPHRYTPLRKSLEFKRSAALLALLGGSMVWASERLKNFADTTVLRNLSEALFCYQIDPLYFNPIEQYRFFPRTDGEPLAPSAVRVYPWIFYQKFFSFPRFWPVYPQIIETAQAIYLTEHIMPKRDSSYKKWVEGAVHILDSAAPFPDCRTEPIPAGSPIEVFEAESRRAIGFPVGPSMLAIGAEFDSATNAAEVTELLAAAGESDNPMLRRPEEMLAMGFSGVPYRFPQ